MTLDTKLRPVAKRLVEKFGSLTTWTVKAPITGSSSGTPSYGTPVEHEVLATPPLPYDKKFINGDTIRASDAVVFLADQDLPFEPKFGVVATIPNQRTQVDEDWTIVNVAMWPTGALVGFWEIQLRR